MQVVFNTNKTNSKYFYQIIFLILIISTTSYSQPKNFRLLFSANLLQNQKIEDAIATTKVLAKNIQNNMKLNEEIIISVCNSIEDLADSMQRPFDFILATSVETEILMKKFKLEPALVNETSGTVGFEFYLLVNSSKNFTDLKSLKNGTINILSKSRYHVVSVWLDKLLRDDKLSIKENFFKNIVYDYKATNVVLPVFFNKSDAAIVSKSAFNLLCELNPQLRKTLKIIKRSPAIVFGAVSFDGRNNDKERKKFIYDILIDLHKEAYGKQMLDIFMVDRLIPFKDEYWQDYLKLYK